MRSVYSKYTIPLYYEYDTAMTPETLNDIIRTIQSYGYHVVGITADNATDNQTCAKRLGVTNDSPWFPNPSPEYEGELVYFFFDAVHLIKLIRNKFLDNGKFNTPQSRYNRKILKVLMFLQSLDFEFYPILT
jgi:hypothetical protein